MSVIQAFGAEESYNLLKRSRVKMPLRWTLSATNTKIPVGLLKKNGGPQTRS